MKALRWHGQKDLRIEDLPKPAMKDNQVRIAIKWCGICGSDLHEYTSGPITIPADKPNPTTGEKAPLVIGHEFAGEVIEVGKDVTRFAVGDRVTAEPIISPFGYHGEYNLNPYAGFIGMNGGGGGFSEELCANEYQVFRLPDNVSYEQGALVEPAAVGFYAVTLSTVKAGDKVAVFGCGPIGLFIIESLKIAGASQIYAVEMNPDRRQMAVDIGAIPIDPAACNPVEEVMKQAGCLMDVVFEVTGVVPVFEQALDLTKLGGELKVVSVWEKNVSFNLTKVVHAERKITGVAAYRHTFQKILDLMAIGHFSADRYVTSKIKLDNVIEEGFEKLLKSKSDIKILVEPN